MEIYKPKTIKEAIQIFQEFLECDLYSKFRPEDKIKGEIWIRDNPFKDEKDFHKYIEKHFDILLKEVEEFLTETNISKEKKGLGRSYGYPTQINRKSKPKFPEHLEHRCNDKDCKICKEFSYKK